MRMTRRGFAGGAGLALAGAMLPAHARSMISLGEAHPIAWLDPELRPSARELLANSAKTPPLSDLTVADRRKAGAASVAASLPDITIAEQKVPGGAGQPPVTVFAINVRAGSRRPAILHTHGGGHVLGQARNELRFLQELARDLDCVIVSVEYRLAPETRFTGSVEDNYAALRWLHGNADALGVDRRRIALLGESAGGTHAALLAIAARDRGEVPLVLQALIYPMLDDRTGSTRRVPPHIGRILWTEESNRYGWSSFLGVAAGGPNVPAAGVPARVASLEGLAPAFIAVGGADLFVSEDIEYARRLTEANVATELLVVPRAYHAFDRIAPETEVARRFREAELGAFRRAFA